MGMASVQFRVIKEADGVHCKDSVVEVLPFTDELCAEIAKYNALLTPNQVRRYLLGGHVIYASFRRYRLEENDTSDSRIG